MELLFKQSLFKNRKSGTLGFGFWFFLKENIGKSQFGIIPSFIPLSVHWQMTLLPCKSYWKETKLLPKIYLFFQGAKLGV